MSQVVLRIEGMHCSSCVRRVTQALCAVPGAEVDEVRIGAARVKLVSSTGPAPLIGALARIGFTATQEA